MRNPRTRNQTVPFTIGILCSGVLHLLLAVIAVLVLESSAAEAVRAPEVFTVTLEGGEQLGGITQIPDKLPEKPEKITSAVAKQEEQAPPEPEPVTADEEETTVEEVEESPEPEAEVESPSVIAERERVEAEKKALEAKKLAEEKKKAEEKKRAEEAKRKAEEKKKAEEAKKKKAEEAKKQKELEEKAREAKRKAERKKAFDRRLSQLRQGSSQKTYEGESYDAGGQGFGAARLGGKGTGGGTLASIEKVAYMNALEQHIKQGWRWIMGNQKLTAVVRFRILRDGTLQNIELAQSSGNGNFDDSVMRAVRKASPVPAPPAKFYNDFSEVRLIFDSKE